MVTDQEVQTAQDELSRRIALAVLAGAQMGAEPYLWLLRRAIDDYRIEAQLSLAFGPSVRLVGNYWLYGPRTFHIGGDSHLAVFVDGQGGVSDTKAVLGIRNAVRFDPCAQLRVLEVIESRIKYVADYVHGHPIYDMGSLCP